MIHHRSMILSKSSEFPSEIPTSNIMLMLAWVISSDGRYHYIFHVHVCSCIDLGIDNNHTCNIYKLGSFFWYTVYLIMQVWVYVGRNVYVMMYQTGYRDCQLDIAFLLSQVVIDCCNRFFSKISILESKS